MCYMTLTSQSQVIDTFKRNKISFAALFGSHAKGSEQASSDYDFLIEFSPSAKHSLFDIVDIKDGLEHILNSKVDVVTTDSLNHRLKDEILSTMQVLYDER